MGEKLSPGDFDQHFDQLGLHQLVGSDGGAELYSFPGVIEGGLVAVHRHAESAPGNAEAGTVKDAEDVAEAARAGQPVFLRDAAVGEGQFADVTGPHGTFARLEGLAESRGTLFHQEATDTIVGFCPDQRQVGDRRVADPLLDAVDNPMVSVPPGGGLQGSYIRAAVRFGEAKAADLPAAGQ